MNQLIAEDLYQAVTKVQQQKVCLKVLVMNHQC